MSETEIKTHLHHQLGGLIRQVYICPNSTIEPPKIAINRPVSRIFSAQSPAKPTEPLHSDKEDPEVIRLRSVSRP
jgi:hypothetical protein